MMASSPSSRAVLTRQRNNHTRVYVTIITIILLNLSISVQSSIFGVHESLTARVGDTVNIHFEYCGRPRPVCTLTQSFTLSAPNPTCIVDRFGHCEVTPAPDYDRLRQELNIGCELCVLVVRGVTQRDAGRYAICQLPGACTSSFWSNIATLEVVSEIEEPPTPTDSTSTKVSTKPITEEKKTASTSTMTVKPISVLSTKYTERVGSNDHYLNERGEHTARNITLTVVGAFIAVIIVVAVIWAIRRVRKQREISKLHDYEGYLPGLSMDPPQTVVGNGYTFHGCSDGNATGKARL